MIFHSYVIIYHRVNVNGMSHDGYHHKWVQKPQKSRTIPPSWSENWMSFLQDTSPQLIHNQKNTKRGCKKWTICTSGFKPLFNSSCVPKNIAMIYGLIVYWKLTAGPSESQPGFVQGVHEGTAKHFHLGAGPLNPLWNPDQTCWLVLTITEIHLFTNFVIELL